MSPLVRLPSVTWMHVHTLRISRASDTEATVDDEGRWTVEPVGPPAEVRGLLCAATRAEVALADAHGVQVTAVARFARGIDVLETDEIIAQNIDPHLDGRYRITAVIPTPVDLRVLLARTVGHDESQLSTQPVT